MFFLSFFAVVAATFVSAQPPDQPGVHYGPPPVEWAGLVENVPYNVYDWISPDGGAAVGNLFRRIDTVHAQKIPSWKEFEKKLPEPFWDGNDEAVDAYYDAWQIARENLKEPTQENGFVASWIDAAFNTCTFMWDSSFMVMFGRYASRVFSFIKTLDNFYAKQHADGFICREIRSSDGTDTWHRHDPASTGPNILPWAEWLHYETFGDVSRLSQVFDALAAYHRWLHMHRTWPDGSFWSCGLASGMDNSPRTPAGTDPHIHHGWMTWVDTTFQMILSSRSLQKIANELNRTQEAVYFGEEADLLTKYANEKLWDEEEGFYFDRLNRENKLSDVTHIGAFWALVAEAVPADRVPRLVSKLFDPNHFFRKHMIPTLSASHPEYYGEGDYWKGSVWAPTNYMVLRGLSEHGLHEEAFKIAFNHHQSVIDVFNDTNTFWENYAPDSLQAGTPSKPNFVGWTGLSPISIFLEYIIGLRPDTDDDELLWDIHLLEKHGVKNYPYGERGLLDLSCDARSSVDDKPKVTVKSTVELTLVVRWGGGKTEKIVVPATKKKPAQQKEEI